ncbi:MAG: hypothetical protein ACPLXC_01915 [Candidatus Pacearchaeota archaeon]
MACELGQIVNNILMFLNSVPEILVKASEETAKFQAKGMYISFPSSIYFACKKYFNENTEKK